MLDTNIFLNQIQKSISTRSLNGMTTSKVHLYPDAFNALEEAEKTKNYLLSKQSDGSLIMFTGYGNISLYKDDNLLEGFFLYF